MEAVIGLLLMLLGVSHGVETCDGRQDGAQCYGALGGTLVLQLMDSASGIHRFDWFKKSTTVVKWRDDNITFSWIKDRSLFTPSNGTFRINDLSRTDGDEYTLNTFDSNGKELEKRTLQLTIEAPVSSVLLVSECLSQGEMRVSCSSEGGDSPQYNWTLDGHTLTDVQLLSVNNETNNITLKRDVSGRLVCLVSNHISNVQKGETIPACDFINCTLSNGTFMSQWVLKPHDIICNEPTTPATSSGTTEGKETGITVSNKPSTNITSPNSTVTSSSGHEPWYSYLKIMAIVLCVLIILLVGGVTVVCAHKKKQRNKDKEEGDEQELTYADVRFTQRPGKQVQQRAEEQVEYGQVKFSERPRQTLEPAGDECVYSMVRKDR